MSDTKAEDLSSSGLLPGSGPPPAPSPTLRASVRAMRPVRPRVPFRTFLVVAGAACVFPVAALAVSPLRRDWAEFPTASLVSVGLVWLAGFIVPLAVAILPPRGQVLPDASRAGRTAILTSLTLILLGLLVTVDAPGATVLPKATSVGFLRLWWHCVSFSLKVTAPAVAVAAIVMRKLSVVSLSRLGAAVGAAAGALAGLTLHGLCQYGGAAHVGLAHGGGVAIGAVVGALWLPILGRVRDRGLIGDE